MRFLGKFLLWGLAILGASVVAGSIAVFLVVANFHEELPELSETSVLHLDLTAQVSEKQSIDDFFGEVNSVRLIDILKALEKARLDPKIRGIVAETGGGSLGMAKSQEVRNAISRFRESGKFTLVYAEDLGRLSGGTLDYYLASAFDEIWLQPTGSVGLTGFVIEQPYLKDILEEWEIQANFEQRHEYKGGIDFFIRSKMPVAVKENLQQLADGWLLQLREDVEKDRPQLAGEIARLIDQSPHLASDALMQGLVDRLAYRDELDQELNDRLGEDWQEVSLRAYLTALDSDVEETFGDDSDARTAIALVYGVGTIDSSSGRMTDDRQFAPYQVANALAEARENDEIKAVLFRVDSPGGAYAQSDMVWREVELLRELGKPVVVSMGEYAASGGYFVSMAADYLLASPGSLTGSIGVYSGKFATRALWEKLGVNWDGVKAGKNAGMWSMVDPFSKSELEKFRQAVDFVYEDFTTKFARNRNLDAKAVDLVARGRVFTGAHALEKGLIDELGGFKEAVDAVHRLLKLPDGASSYLVEIPRPLSPFEQVQAFISDGDGFLIERLMGRYMSKKTGLTPAEMDLFYPQAGVVQMPRLVVR